MDLSYAHFLEQMSGNPLLTLAVVLTWVLTFPGCGLVGFLMTKLFMFMFT